MCKNAENVDVIAKMGVYMHFYQESIKPDQNIPEIDIGYMCLKIREKVEANKAFEKLPSVPPRL